MHPKCQEQDLSFADCFFREISCSFLPQIFPSCAGYTNVRTSLNLATKFAHLRCRYGILTSVVLVRSLHFSNRSVTVCKTISIIVIVLVIELNHFSAY